MKRNFIKVRKYKLSNKVTFFLSLVFLVLAIYYLWIEIASANSSIVQVLNNTSVSSLLISLAVVFFLQFLNWFIEALKFKVLLQKDTSLSILIIIKSIYIGNFTAFFTPERIGNFIGRAMVFKDKKEEVVLATLLGNLAQLIITVVVGLISMVYLKVYLFKELFNLAQFQFIPLLFYFLLLVILLFGFFNSKVITVFSKIRFIEKWANQLKKLTFFTNSSKFYALFLASLRYLVFYFQYLILANTLHLDIDFINLFAYVGVLFGLVTFIPSPLPGNLGTREGLASFLLGGGLIGIQFSFISFFVWLINVGFASIFGGIIYSYTYLKK